MSEAVSTPVFLALVEQTRNVVQLTASVRIFPQIPVPRQVPHYYESNGLEKCWSAGYRGTDVIVFSN
jgi:hypothetical protein